MRQRRTIYYDDARHYYLWHFEPPMDLHDAWTPVDQIAGTAVDTFIYGVSRGDGLFYDTKVSTRFGTDRESFRGHYEWRAYQCLQSLIDRGLSPLGLLIDRAHEKGMEFMASLRLGEYAMMDPALNTKNGGRGWVNQEIPDHLFSILEELATEFDTNGVELDFTAPPGGSGYCLLPGDVPKYTPLVTEWVEKVSKMVRNRPNGPGAVGARVYPTEQLNLDAGLDVKTWLNEGYVDFVVPLIYAHNILDADMPIDWLVKSAHDADISVYAFLMILYNNEERDQYTREFATPDMMRAAASNYWDRDCDGMYTWFLEWPLGDKERRILSQLGDPDLVKEGRKHYFVNRRTIYSEKVGFKRSVPVEIPEADPTKRYQVPFYLADDFEGALDRISRVLLKLHITNGVRTDELTILLNGQSLAEENCLRLRNGYNVWVEFDLHDIWPKKGRNILEISLDRRPNKLVGGIAVEDVEMIVEYGL